MKTVNGSIMPNIGDEIYVIDNENNLGNFKGGKARVVYITERKSAGGRIYFHYVMVEEHPSCAYNWEEYLEPMQDKLKMNFGNQRASAEERQFAQK